MRFRQIESPLGVMLLMMALITSCGSVWASSTGCAYPHSGTGMGGTGTVARGTGIGGTGISPEAGTTAIQLAGNVIFAKGTIEAQRDGNTRRLAKGDAVCVGETIITSRSGNVQMKMVDQAMIAVGPLTQLRIAKYVYGGTSKDTSLLALLTGTSRFITGNIGKAYPQNDLIETPTATIGVRGTDHEARVILPNEKSGYPSGTYDKVNSGITFIKTANGEVEIHPNQVGFAGNNAELPVLLGDMPNFYSVNPSIRLEGRPSEGKNRQEDIGDDKNGSKSSEQSGDGTKFDEPSESSTPGSERADRHNDKERPESMARPEPPERPERPDLPSHPELPELPSHPELPELPHPPELPDLSGQADF